MSRIVFIVDGQDWGADTWAAVPRVGEKIAFPADGQLQGTFVVVDVVWQVSDGDVVAHVHLEPSGLHT
jgi:hypothetical protein